jgi:RNA polymerase sigma-70 factor (ECF subfamily)
MLHANTCEEDVAISELLRTLPPKLRARFPLSPEDTVVEAVEDAILDHLARPGRFDPLRGKPLEQFLYFAALRNLCNLIETERRRKSREAMYAFLHQPVLVPNVDGETTYNALRAIALDSALDAREAAAIRLWFDGDRSTLGLAKALKVTATTAGEQRREVKRFKDRVLKRLRRVLDRRVP